MTCPLRNYPEPDRFQVALRRLKQPQLGLGKLSAEDYMRKTQPTQPKPKR